ncbi:MAG TPA: ABC transporter substrate-binding protein, partial [Ktedonobacterales bacterium]
MSRRSNRGSGRWQGAMLALALAALLAGCSTPTLPTLPWQQTSSAPLPAAQQIVHLAMWSNDDDAERTLDPAQSDFFVSGWAQIDSLLYSGLFTLDGRLRPVPALATSYSVSADGLRYTFHLRAGVRFAEGTPLTSADVAFSLNRVMSGCAPSGASGLFPDVKDAAGFIQQCRGGPPPGARAVTTLVGDALLTPDPNTFVMVLTRPDSALISKLAEPYSLIVEQSFVTNYGAYWPEHLAEGGGQGTSGMYSVAAWTAWGPYHEGVRSDASLTLRVAPGYWGSQPLLRQVVIALRNRQLADTTSPDSFQSSFFALKPSDEIVFDTSPLNLFALQTGARGLTFTTALERSVDALALDPHTAPLDDPRLRQALVLALDKTQLAKLDDGTATSQLIPPGTGDYPTTLSGPVATTPLTGDVAQAQTLWQSYVHDRCAGVASRCPAITAFDDGQIGV